MKKLLVVLGIVAGIFSGAWAVDYNSCANYNAKDKECYYNPNIAAKYALKNLDISKWNNYFPSYKYLGGDCTNFANQAIVAGFIGNYSPRIVRSKVGKYNIDKVTYAPYQWYFENKNSRSYSWKGAQEFFDYVNHNSNHSFNGLHLDFIMKDSKTSSLNFSKIKVGDVMFVDWEGDDDIDHTMIVTEKSYNGYCGIRVTYQNDDTHTPKYNKRLCEINEINTVFYDYRPIFYTEGGY